MAKGNQNPAPGPRFIVDVMLGKLAKWLRILGFDALYSNAWSDRDLLRIALAECRIILTRDTHLIREIRNSSPFLFLENDSFWHQIREVFSSLDLSPRPDHFFTRCSCCNTPLENLPREIAAGKVPEYIYQTQSQFARCPGCERIYWSGSHRKRAEAMLSEILSPGPEPG